MARFALAWELGAGLGHAMPLAQLAQTLLDRGHEVHLLWKDLAPVAAVFTPLTGERLHLWQAPLWLHNMQDAPDAVSYSELLLQAGYLDCPALLAIVRAWREVMAVIEPDLLIADHAPTALLAARGLPFARAMFGNGFMIPPMCQPLPAFREWESPSGQRLASADARALLTCNQVLDLLGEPPLDALHELLMGDEHFLLGWPELDHYRSARAAKPMRNWGWPEVPVISTDPVWPPAPGPRTLAYLARDHPALDAVLAILREGPWCTLMVVLGASDQETRDGSSPRLQISNRPVNMAGAIESADLLLSHSGSGLLYQAMAAGLPSVLLPTQVEQLLLARRVAAAGAGVVLWPHEVGHSLAKAIDAVIGSSGFATAARRLAAQNSVTVHGNVLVRIAERCEQLSGQAR